MALFCELISFQDVQLSGALLSAIPQGYEKHVDVSRFVSTYRSPFAEQEIGSQEDQEIAEQRHACER